MKLRGIKTFCIKIEKDFLKIYGNTYTLDSYNNTPNSILSKLNKKLYIDSKHPLGIITNKVESFFTNNPDKASKTEVNKFSIIKDLPSIVSKEECFTNLLVKEDNETLSPKNTYYLNENTLLRTHMTTHDISLIRKGLDSFITVGDVYRRDTVDTTHYPVFHQVDGVKIFNTSNKSQVFQELTFCLENLMKYLLKTDDLKFRWVEAYFPFTDPSAELEIFYQNQWLEVLGCGVLRDGVLEKAGIDPKLKTAYAFGLGLERFAMLLFKIPDIRLFWSNDNRFKKQFQKSWVLDIINIYLFF